MQTRRGRGAALAAFLLTAATSQGVAQEVAEPAPVGHAILQKNCGRCHAIGRSDSSPLAMAPPLRMIYRQRSEEQLEFEFAEGMGSRHPEMPQIQFSSEEIAAVLTYLRGITAEK